MDWNNNLSDWKNEVTKIAGTAGKVAKTVNHIAEEAVGVGDAKRFLKHPTLGGGLKVGLDIAAAAFAPEAIVARGAIEAENAGRAAQAVYNAGRVAEVEAKMAQPLTRTMTFLGREGAIHAGPTSTRVVADAASTGVSAARRLAGLENASATGARQAFTNAAAPVISKAEHLSRIVSGLAGAHAGYNVGAAPKVKKK
jgi:hypothetical protein